MDASLTLAESLSSHSSASVVASRPLASPSDHGKPPSSVSADSRPSRHSSMASRHSPLLDPVKVVELECAELRERTVLLCDEMSDFQRIVSHRSAERHGAWTYSMETQDHQYFCDQCGHYVTATRAPLAGAAEPVPFELHGRPIRTPACGFAELQSSEGCYYSRDALNVLRQRESFDQDVGVLLKRLRVASKGIQDSVI